MPIYLHPNLQSLMDRMAEKHAWGLQEALNGLLDGCSGMGGSFTRPELERMVREAFVGGAISEYCESLLQAKKDPVAAFEDRLKASGQIVENRLPGFRFIVVAQPLDALAFEEKDHVEYISNGDRQEVIETLRELLERIGACI